MSGVVRYHFMLAAIAPLFVTRDVAAQAMLGTEIDPAPIVADADWNRAVGAEAAFGGRETLVVWRDDRALDDFRTIYGARIDSTGRVLDPVGIPIARTPDEIGSPAIGFDGENFVVAWMQFAPPALTGDVRFVRIRPDGARIDSAPIVVARETASDLDDLSAVTDSVGVLLAWRDYGSAAGPHGLHAIHIARDGSTVEPAPVSVVASTTCQGRLDVAFDGTHDWFAWDDYPCDAYETDAGHVLAMRVAPPTLAPVDSVPIAMPDSHIQFGARIGCTSSQCLVTWNPIVGIYATGVAGARVRTDGTLVDTTPITVLADSDMTVREPGPVGIVGDDFFATWSQWPGPTSRIFGIPVHANGAVGTMIEAPLGTQNAEAGPFVTTPAGALWIWPGAWNYGGPVRAARVASDLATVAPSVIDIQTSANPTRSPSLGAVGPDLLLAWRDARGVSTTRLDATGHPLAGDRAVIPGSLTVAGTPIVSHAGATYVVAWRSTGGAVGASRVARDGVVIDRDPILVAASSGYPDHVEGPVAVSAAGYAWLAWSEHFRGGGVGANTIQVSRVSSDGSVTMLDVPMHPDHGEVRGPALASNGVFTLLTWEDIEGLHAALYRETEGTLRDIEPITLVSVPSTLSTPVASSDSAGFLVVWRTDEGAASYLEAMRLAFDGLPADHAPVRVASLDATASPPVVAFDGATYRVLWTSNPPDSLPVLFDVAIDSDGHVSAPRSVLIDGATTPVHEFAWAVPESSHGVIAYQRFDETDPFGAVRVRTRGWSDPSVVSRDGGVTDVIETVDATDAPASSDGSTADASAPSARAGCGCRVADRRAAHIAWLFVFIAAMSARRKRLRKNADLSRSPHRSAVRSAHQVTPHAPSS